MAPLRNANFIKRYVILLNIFVVLVNLVDCRLITDKITTADCKKGATDLYHQVFDSSNFRCVNCKQPQIFQTVSADGLRCICQRGYKLSKNFGGIEIECQQCGANEIVSFTGWECVNCKVTPTAEECLCNTNDRKITVERNIDGSWVDRNNRGCLSCGAETEPNFNGRLCERCTQILQLTPSATNQINKTNCFCPPTQKADGVCFESLDEITPNLPSLFSVEFGEETVDSLFFASNVRSAYSFCLKKYANLTACQLLGNMCTMILNTKKNVGDSTKPDACTLYINLRNSAEGNPDWKNNMPMLYFDSVGNADSVLKDDSISTSFKFPNMPMPLLAAKYSYNGTFLGMEQATGELLQLCKNHQSYQDSALLFGTDFIQECSIPVKKLFDDVSYETVFYDLFLEYEENKIKKLYSIPIVLEDFKSSSDKSPNAESDETKWQLTRRFFLVDRVSGWNVPSSTSTGTGGTGATGGSTGSANPAIQANVVSKQLAIRYASSITLTVRLQEQQSNGKIYPPFLKIKYSVAKLVDYESDKKVNVKFQVIYEMNISEYERATTIAIGVLGGLAVIYAIFLTWNYHKRCGKMAIDCATLLKFLLIYMAALGNVFFIVAFGSAFWWFITFKNQNSVVLLPPTKAQEGRFTVFIVLAMVFKLIDLLHMIIVQSTVDIFYVDWERPKKDDSVSIWRTYFVANEWNEIQTFRKTSPTFQLIVCLLFLNVIGFENLATKDPQSRYRINSSDYASDYSAMFRFAIGSAVYLVVGIVQWLFYIVIYQRFIEDKISQYVDFCSLSNVSVFILENDLFGYYIHGRSPHGRADASLREMYVFLDNERNDKCPMRGLLPNSNQQTFQMAIPSMLRRQYFDEVLPLMRFKNDRATGDLKNKQQQADQLNVETYTSINKLLQSYIQSGREDMKYTIQSKTFLESLFNIEIDNTQDSGIFYDDAGHSFDSVLFYGNETPLIIFDLIVFNLIDYFAKNFVLAAIITYMIMKIYDWLRDSLGKMNLVKKTLVDDRFLI